jgi:hypothetical protein
MTQQLEEVRALTWDGRPSFAMVGIYGVDATGRWVITHEGRYQIPDDAIVRRSPAPAQQAASAPQPTQETAPSPAPANGAPAPRAIAPASKPAQSKRSR